MTDYINVEAVTDKQLFKGGANDSVYWPRGYLSSSVSSRTFGGVKWGIAWYYRTASCKQSLYLIEEMEVKDTSIKRLL